MTSSRPPDVPPDLPSWRTVFRRSSVGGPSFAIRRNLEREILGAVDRGLAELVPVHAVGSLYESLIVSRTFLDGGIVTGRRYGIYDPQLHGSWVVGTQALRLLCAMLRLRPPARLKEEDSVPTMDEVTSRFHHQLDEPRQLAALDRILGSVASGARLEWAGWVGAQPDPRRWAAYIDSAIHLDLGQHGAFLLTPGHGGHGTHPDVEGDLHIVTAYNPGRLLSDAENRRRDRQLRHELEAAGQTFRDAVGMALDTDHFEPSVVLMGASADTALALARRFGQDAIFTVSGRALVLVSTHGGPPLARPCRSIATRPDDRVATPDQSPLDLDDPQSLVAFWKRTGAVRLNIDRSVASHMRDLRDRDNPVVVPGTPPAWHEVEAGLWMGDGRCAPGHQFDRVITLDQAVADHRPPDRTVDLVFAMQEAAPIDEPRLRVAVSHIIHGLHAGKRVLVRSRNGSNRAGLVVGEALVALGMPRDQIVEHLRDHRGPDTLSDPRFVERLSAGTEP